MDIKEVKEIIDILTTHPDIEELEIENNGIKIMMRQKYHNNDKRRKQEMMKEQCELVKVKAPAVGKFYSIAFNKNKKEVGIEELKRIITNGNNRIEINPGLCVFNGQVLGTIIQLNIPVPVEAPCEGVIQSAFLNHEEQLQQLGCPVGYGEVLFVIKKT